MHRNATLLVTLLAAVAATSSAQAAGKPLNTLSTGLTNFQGKDLTGHFDDAYSFSVATNASITVSAADINLSKLGYQAGPLSLELEDAKGNELASSPVGQILSYANLSKGQSYSIVVHGDVLGKKGGLYGFTTTVSAVPIPASVMLFGSALLGLTAAARRRTKISAS